MELATIFLIWIALTIIDNLAKRKKRRLPPPESESLPSNPNFPGEEVPIAIENPQQAEIRPQFQPPPPKKITAQAVRETEKNVQLDLTLKPSTAMNAFMWSEIFGKPKALRRRR